MADVKVSGLPALAAGDLDLVNDMIMVVDASAGQSKRMSPGELLRASAPYLSTFWDFTAGSLLPTVAFTRASSGWRFNSSGVLVPETMDAPRFQYDPATLTPRGLLVEDARTNLVRQSAGFDSAVVGWSRVRLSVTDATMLAPDGAVAMDKLTEAATAVDNHFVESSSFSTTSGTYYIMSVYAKADTRSWLYFWFMTNFNAFSRAWFNVTAGAGVVGAIAGDVVAAFIQDVGNGIYRCIAIAPANLTGAAAQMRIGLATGDLNVNYAGDGTSGLYLWGADVQDGTMVSSHVPTAAAAVTRSADLALITNLQVLADRCWIIRARTPRRIPNGSLRPLVQIDNGTSDHYISVQWNTDNNIRLVSRVNGVTQVTLNIGTVASDTDFTVAVRFADNNFAGSLNGGAIVAAMSGSVPVGLTTARVGRNASGNAWNSTIRTFETRRAATDAELPLLSA